MVKGQDALLRKKNKVNRKRMRGSESAVTARIAAIISSKRRRLAGKRRACEGMCFSLPTPDDPFNDRATAKPSKKPKKPKKPPPPPPPKTPAAVEVTGSEGPVSKFFILCLKAIQSAWEEEGSQAPPLMASRWGAEFCRRCCAGASVVDTSGACAGSEQVAWLVSMAADRIATQEKQGLSVSSPFLLYLVPSQEKAIQVRSVCKPLKALGVHTVSLHPGAALDHQVRGLKSCEPEFLVSTPERLLELLSLGAIGISGTTLLVVDGLKDFVDSGFLDKVKSIRESITGDPQLVVFGDCYGEEYTTLMQNLLRGPIYRFSEHDSVASQSAFISQYVHFHKLEEEKLPKSLQILREATHDQSPYQDLRVLFITNAASKAKLLASKIKAEGFSVVEHLRNTESSPSGAKRLKAAKVLVKDIETVRRTNVEKFEIVIFMELPSSIEDYVAILVKMARQSVSGVLHSFFSKADAPLAQPLINVLEQCRQRVPQSIRKTISS